MTDILATLETYYDAVPRTSARVEPLGPLTLFVSTSASWPFYARPALGASDFSAAEVARVRERQRTLGVPEAFEWVSETTPGLRAAAEAAGLHVIDHPLLVLDPAERRTAPALDGVTVRLVGPDDHLERLTAVASVAFSSPGTAAGVAGADEVAVAAAAQSPEFAAFVRDRLLSGRTCMAAAFVDGQPVAVGSHQPIGDVSEIVGVGTLPTYRRRGIAAALTDFLVEDALKRGVRMIFLSADDAAVARVYASLGFRPAGTASIAEPEQQGEPG
jgi:ribosomal protein S18 acetylase RimI-like enzyme